MVELRELKVGIPKIEGSWVYFVSVIWSQCFLIVIFAKSHVSKSFPLTFKSQNTVQKPFSLTTNLEILKIYIPCLQTPLSNTLLRLSLPVKLLGLLAGHVYWTWIKRASEHPLSSLFIFRCLSIYKFRCQVNYTTVKKYLLAHEKNK